MNHAASVGLTLAALSFLVCSCGSSQPSTSSGSPAPGSEATGEVNLAIAVVPPGVQCIQITATGSYTVTQSFAATPDAGTVGSLALGELPLGSVAITGQAFNVPCASIGSQQPSWVADKQVITLQPGVPTSLTITFRPDTPVTGTPSFVGGVVQIAPGYEQIGVVMSDGTVEEAGNMAGLFSSFTGYSVVPGLSNVAQLAPATADTWDCALLKNGTVECWGTTNAAGQLGNGTTTASTTPVAVTGLSNVTQICAGQDHACALEAGGAVVCWGNNSNGQLGNNTTTNATTPVLVGLGSSAASIACGGSHTCATVNGLFAQVACWGSNAFGQLGNNATADSHVPVTVSNLSAITQLSLEQNGTCALRSDGTVFCWGYNGNGDLGIGNLTNALVPTKVVISGVVQQISSSYDTTCARRNDGAVFCWGWDGYGNVGDGSGAGAITAPSLVMGLPPSAAISLGSEDSCSLGTDLSLECWGVNNFGQLATSNFFSVFTPTPIKL
jgi:hypothetical protein